MQICFFESLSSFGWEKEAVSYTHLDVYKRQELKEEVERVSNLIRQEYLGKEMSGKNYLFDYLDPEIAEQMEKTRLGGQTHDKKDE